MFSLSVFLGKTRHGELRALKVLQQQKMTEGEVFAASVLDQFVIFCLNLLHVRLHSGSVPLTLPECIKFMLKEIEQY